MVQQQNINQFAMTSQQGQIDLPFGGSVLSCQVASDQDVALVPGQAVKLVNVGGGAPKVASLTDDTEEAFGFVVLNLKGSEYAANAMVEIATNAGVMWMTSGAAIGRGVKIEVNNADTTVIANAGTNPVSGFALDKTTGANQLMRVWILTPGYALAQTIGDIAGLQAALDAKSQSFSNTVTLAEVNAGKTILAVAPGKKAIVTSFIARSTGTFGGLTSIELNVGAAVVASLAVAQLATGVALFPGETGVTAGAGLGIAGADGADITVSKTGGAGTTATNIVFTVTYQLVDA